MTHNPPAYPVPAYVNADGETHYPKYLGMTLRDYFAGQALAGHLTNSRYQDDPADVARFCYSQAHAMLEERAAVESLKGTDAGA